MQVFTESASHFCPILTKLEAGRLILVRKKISNIKFHENWSSWSRCYVPTDGRTCRSYD